MDIKGTLVLEGGGSRGVFTAGVLDYLMEKNVNLSHVVGVSAGACNAIDYLSRQIGRTKSCMIIDKKENRYIHMKNMLLNKPVFDLEKAIRTFWIETFPFDYDLYKKSEKKCFIVVSNATTGKAEYLDDRNDMERLINIVEASCNVPILNPEVKIDNIPYFDGGVIDAVPVDFAETLGNKKMVIILTRPKGYRKKEINTISKKIVKRKCKEFPRISNAILNRYRVYNSTMDKIEKLENNGKIFVIRPRKHIVDRAETDIHKLELCFDEAYNISKERYKKLCEYLTRD